MEPGGETKCEVWRYGQEKNAVYTCVRVCAQTCVWFIVNNVALQRYPGERGWIFLSADPCVTQRAALVVMSECVYAKAKTK